MNKLSFKRFEFIRLFVAVTIGIMTATVIIFAVSNEPIAALRYLFLGPVTRWRYLYNVIELMIPLMFCGVAISVMFSAGQFNLATEGAFFIGGMVAAVAAIILPLPPFIHPMAAILLGGLTGALVGAIPGIMKYKLGAPELVVSLMLNYICYYAALYIIKNFFRDDTAGFAVSLKFKKTAIMKPIFSSFGELGRIFSRYRVTDGIFIVVGVVIFAYIFMYNTKWGFSIRMAGENMDFARYSGFNIGFIIVGSQMIGGAIAGMGGAVEMLSMYTRFQWSALTGYGWDGIIIAIFAKNNPRLVPGAAFFLAYLRIGADIMSRQTDVQMEIIRVIQAIIIVLLVAERFLSGYKHRMIVKKTAINDARIKTEVSK